MAGNEVTTGEIMDFLRENLVMRDEVREIVKSEIHESENRVLTTVDRFTKLHETLDQELVMLRSKYNRLEERMEIVEQRLGIPI